MSSTAIFIPSFNEEDFIADVLKGCLQHDCDIYVVDGGSDDNTRSIVERIAQRNERRIHLLDNPGKIQACAMRVFLDQCGGKYDYVIRMDVHAKYPSDFIPGIVGLLEQGLADSIVVPMRTVGESGIQRSASFLFNDVLGNGGAAHRGSSVSRYVDHGHHAGFSMSSLLENEGYDEYFVANEDAEYDFRLLQKGGKIYLSVEHEIEYYPRDTYAGFYRQYVKYGFYRAANLIKHQQVPKMRQVLPVAAFISCVFFVVCLMLMFFSFWWLVLGVGFFLYSIAVFIMVNKLSCSWRDRVVAFKVAVVSHLSFGLGFSMRCIGLMRPIFL